MSANEVTKITRDATRQRVIKGIACDMLEPSVEDDCHKNGCPYCNDPECMEHLMRDVLSLISPERAYPIMPEELKDFIGETVWYHSWNHLAHKIDLYPDEIEQIVWRDSKYDGSDEYIDGAGDVYPRSMYWKNYTFWTAKPTDEDMRGMWDRIEHPATTLEQDDVLATPPARLVTEADFEDADQNGFLPVWCERNGILFAGCIAINHLKDMEGCRFWTSKPTDAQRKAHPAPVYPTWYAWLANMNVVPIELPPDQAVMVTDIGLLNKIPADIAEKLGIQPKEVE